MSQHLKEMNETYLEHWWFAQKGGWRMVIAGLACVIHGFIPDIFVTTATDARRKSEQEMVERKNKMATRGE